MGIRVEHGCKSHQFFLKFNNRLFRVEKMLFDENNTTEYLLSKFSITIQGVPDTEFLLRALYEILTRILNYF